MCVYARQVDALYWSCCQTWTRRTCPDELVLSIETAEAASYVEKWSQETVYRKRSDTTISLFGSMLACLYARL